MRKLFKERKLFKGGNYMRKYGNCFNNYLQKYGILIDVSAELSISCFYVPYFLN